MDWAAEKRKEATQRLRIRMITKTIADMVGWSFDYGVNTSRWYNMHDKAGNTIMLKPSWKDKGRITVLSKAKYAERSTDTITVAANRPPHAIKKDIARRIMPLLKKQYHESKKQHDQQRTQKMQLIDTARSLCRAQGLPLMRIRDHIHYPEWLQITIPIPGGKCTIRHKDFPTNGAEPIECQCNIDLTPDTAKKLVCAIAETEES